MCLIPRHDATQLPLRITPFVTTNLEFVTKITYWEYSIIIVPWCGAMADRNHIKISEATLRRRHYSLAPGCVATRMFNDETWHTIHTHTTCYNPAKTY